MGFTHPWISIPPFFFFSFFLSQLPLFIRIPNHQSPLLLPSSICPNSPSLTLLSHKSSHIYFKTKTIVQTNMMTSPMIKTKAHTHKLISLNTKGLNILENRSQLLTSLRSMRADKAFLQETHLCTKSIPKLQHHFFSYVYHATYAVAKNKEDSILISKNIPFKIPDTLINDQGRYIFLKGTIRDKPITLANIYSPNISQVPFFHSVASLLPY